jgi:hypothetical protein
MSNAEVSETTLRLERFIPSPPEVLFALWIEPAHLLKWWAPEGYEPAVDILDTRPGGRWLAALKQRSQTARLSFAVSSLRRQNPREEPGALAAHAGICAGGRGEILVLTATPTPKSRIIEPLG